MLYKFISRQFSFYSVMSTETQGTGHRPPIPVSEEKKQGVLGRYATHSLLQHSVTTSISLGFPNGLLVPILCLGLTDNWK